MRFLISIVAITNALMPFGAIAAPGQTNQFSIRQMVPREMGYDIVADGSITSPMSCPNTGGVRIALTAQNYQALIASLLTAFAANKQVTLWVNSCDGSDGVGLAIAAWVNR